jgi:hypothetical protein
MGNMFWFLNHSGVKTKRFSTTDYIVALSEQCESNASVGHPDRVYDYGNSNAPRSGHPDSV